MNSTEASEPNLHAVPRGTSQPVVTATCDQTLDRVRRARESGQMIGLVPTMGALHEGHLRLVREAKRQCDFVAVSVFVNPMQFNDVGDLNRYPRTWSADLQVLSCLGVDLIFAPNNEEMYPAGFSTKVLAPRVAEGLEGDWRSGHFDGVATVVLKLFQVVPADVAFFGEKDFQQVLVIRDMIRDLSIPIRLHACPIVREADGLAMSSRNQRLSVEERRQALALSRALHEAEALYNAGERDALKLEQHALQVLQDNGVDPVDYVAVRCALTLKTVRTIERPAVLLIAAHVGSTRLIDNRRLG